MRNVVGNATVALAIGLFRGFGAGLHLPMLQVHITLISEH